MKFDPTVTLGVVLHLTVLVATVIVAIVRLTRRLEHRIDAVQRDLERRIGDGPVPLAQRISLLEQRVDELWHWFRARFKANPGRTVPGEDSLD